MSLIARLNNTSKLKMDLLLGTLLLHSQRSAYYVLLRRHSPQRVGQLSLNKWSTEGLKTIKSVIQF